jgi:hypothetical protein
MTLDIGKLAKWYRIIDIEPNEEKLGKRLNAINEILKKDIDSEYIINLVRLYKFGNNNIDDFIDHFRESMCSTDPIFPTDGNDLELQTLAGATLVAILEDDDDYDEKEFCSYVLECSKFIEQQNSIPEMSQLSIHYLQLNSEEKRKPTLLAKKSDISKTFRDNKKKQTELVKDGITEANISTVLGSVSNLASNSFSEISSIIKAFNLSVEHFNLSQKVSQEETNILWWLFGEYSRDLDKRMIDLGILTMSIVGAKELADLTEIIPGPISSKAFLDKMLHLSSSEKIPEEITLSEAVNTLPLKWKEKWMKEIDITPFEDFVPVLNAIQKSVELGEENWEGVYTNKTGINSKETIYPIDLAYQVYQECLLIKSYLNLN